MHWGVGRGNCAFVLGGVAFVGGVLDGVFEGKNGVFGDCKAQWVAPLRGRIARVLGGGLRSEWRRSEGQWVGCLWDGVNKRAMGCPIGFLRRKMGSGGMVVAWGGQHGGGLFVVVACGGEHGGNAECGRRKGRAGRGVGGWWSGGDGGMAGFPFFGVAGEIYITEHYTNNSRGSQGGSGMRNDER